MVVEGGRGEGGGEVVIHSAGSQRTTACSRRTIDFFPRFLSQFLKQYKKRDFSMLIMS